MGMSDIGDEHYSKIMDVNTIVHIVVSLSVIVVVLTTKRSGILGRALSFIRVKIQPLSMKWMLS